MTTSAKFKRFMADKEAKRDSEAEKPLTLDVVLSGVGMSKAFLLGGYPGFWQWHGTIMDGGLHPSDSTKRLLLLQ
ncbi:hypothetical protein HYQ46_006121 [Verticillium longisporum]|nr:hypothetical protein HYQ46_006121 [Verticillium longisporum]